MFTLRRFVSVPQCSRAAVATTTTAVAAATTPILASSMNSISNTSINFQQNQQQVRRNNNNNNNNRGNSGMRSDGTYSDEHPRPTPARVSGFTRNGEAFMELNNAADLRHDGYRLFLSFPGTDVPYMDISYCPQVRDKVDNSAAAASSSTTEESSTTTSAEDKTPKSNNVNRRQRIFGGAVINLGVRIYPIQMCRVVAVLEGKSNEAVITSKFATGTFKRNADGTISYAVQRKAITGSNIKVDENAPTSFDINFTPVQAFMLEKFLGKMMVIGFDPSRNDVPPNKGF